jgi:LacI family transcriptional regulator
MSQESPTDAVAVGAASAAEVFALLERARQQRPSATSAADPAKRAPMRSRARSQGLVGVVSLARESTAGPFWQPLLASACCSLLRVGYEPFRCDLEPESNAAAAALRDRCGSGTCGLVVVGATSRDEPVLGPLLAIGIPVALVDFDRLGDRVAHVMSNNLEGMASVVRHLFRLGCRRIATLAGPAWTLPGADRLLGYRSAISALGLEEREQYVVEGIFAPAEGRAGCETLLALREPPDAIACASDTLAVGAIVALEQAGLSVPRDVAVTGFDDVGFARRMRPSLTTVRQDAVGLAGAAVDALLRMIDDPAAAPSTTLLPTQLVVRQSSCALG